MAIMHTGENKVQKYDTELQHAPTVEIKRNLKETKRNKAFLKRGRLITAAQSPK